MIGLQSGIDLLKAGYRVTIIAAHLPGDEAIEYTSPWYVLDLFHDYESHCFSDNIFLRPTDWEM